VSDVSAVGAAGGEASAPNASTAQARVLVDELARGGLTDVVLCPGSRSAPFAFALDAEPRIRLHLHPDERSAAFVALGIAQVTGRPAAVVVTSGSAVANLHPAVVEADAAACRCCSSPPTGRRSCARPAPTRRCVRSASSGAPCAGPSTSASPRTAPMRS
jgi:hypothetical protein